MRVCSKCCIAKEESLFGKRGNSNLQGYCKDCSRENGRLWYRNNKASVLKRSKENKNRSMDFVINYLKNHPCVDCGETDIVVLDFDHLERKYRAVSKMAHEGYSVSTLIEEIAKCEVVCANDHRRRTARRSSDWRRGQIEV